MTILEFFHEHWFLAFLVIWGICQVIYSFIKAITIIIRGYPPETTNNENKKDASTNI